MMLFRNSPGRSAFWGLLLQAQHPTRLHHMRAHSAMARSSSGEHRRCGALSEKPITGKSASQGQDTAGHGGRWALLQEVSEERVAGGGDGTR